MEKLSERYTKIEQQLLRMQGHRDAVQKQLSMAQEQIAFLKQETITVANARKLLEVFVRSTEVQVRNYIEPVITEALEFVFAQGLKFHLFFTTRRNQVEVDFIILRSAESEKEYQEYIADPAKYEKQLESLVKETKNLSFMYGGAVNQVLALVLRLVLVELFKIQGPVFLDEPTSAVGEEYSGRVGQLISSLSKRFNRQYVLVTHSKVLASFAEKIYSIEKVGSFSQAKLAENI